MPLTHFYSPLLPQTNCWEHRSQLIPGASVICLELKRRQAQTPPPGPLGLAAFGCPFPAVYGQLDRERARMGMGRNWQMRRDRVQVCLSTSYIFIFSFLLHLSVHSFYFIFILSLLSSLQPLCFLSLHSAIKCRGLQINAWKMLPGDQKRPGGNH